jgi:hypothetical protein
VRRQSTIERIDSKFDVKSGAFGEKSRRNLSAQVCSSRRRRCRDRSSVWWRPNRKCRSSVWAFVSLAAAWSSESLAVRGWMQSDHAFLFRCAAGSGCLQRATFDVASRESEKKTGSGRSREEERTNRHKRKKSSLLTCGE